MKTRIACNKLLALLLALVMVMCTMPASAFAAYEDGQDCYSCGSYRYDDWLCEECGGCAPGYGYGCGDSIHCYECEACFAEVEYCGDCGICIDCAVDLGEHCYECGECLSEVNFCKECGLCENCFGEWCDDGELCIACCIDGENHCIICGDHVEGTKEWCPLSGAGDHCLDCAMEDQTLACESCGNWMCQYCDDYAEDLGLDGFCEDCGLCYNCIVAEGGIHCADCFACLVSNEVCGDSTDCEAEPLCMECCIDKRNHCIICDDHVEGTKEWCPLSGARDHCLDCAMEDRTNVCESCGNWMCQYCDDYAEDLGLDGFCEDCGLCYNCIVAEGGIHCADCFACLVSNEVCGDSTDCEAEPICMDCCIDKGNHCTICDDHIEGTKEWCPIDGTGNHCLDCAMEDRTNVCESCGNWICPYCDEYVEDLELDGFCEDCSLCYNCIMNSSEPLHCIDCFACFGEVSNYCSNCGYCDNCVIVCPNGDACSECGTLCEVCGLCSECVTFCEGCGTCSECAIVCEDCGGYCRECDSNVCEECRLCEECAINNGLHCPNCEACYEDVDEVCEGCGACSECAIVCEECGAYCSECAFDFCEDCLLCEDCALLNGSHCPNCEECLGDIDDVCEECELCLECCAQNAFSEGCNCEEWICSEAPGFEDHFQTEHGGVIDTSHDAKPLSKWSSDENSHWHDCANCEEEEHRSNAAAHSFGPDGKCTVCGRLENTKILIISQPKDVTNVFVSDANREDWDTKMVSFKVNAVGNSELTYQWFRKSRSGVIVALTDCTPYEGECYTGSEITVLVGTDTCYDFISYYCVITDGDGNEVTTREAALKAKHAYSYWRNIYDHSPSWFASANAAGHILECVGEGCEMLTKRLPHVDEDNNRICDECDFLLDASYTIISGAGQTVKRGSGAFFKSNAPFYKFAKVQVDGTDVDASNYTATSGSTDIMFSAEYIDTLSNGTHTLEIISTDSEAATTFNVVESTDENPGEQPGENPGEQPGENPGTDSGDIVTEKYDVTVIRGRATIGEGTAVTESEAGVTITIKADDAPAGKVFDKWIIKSDTQPVFAKDADATTTFIMPKGDIIVEAAYKDAPVTSGTDTKPAGQNVPKTGDSSHIFLWTALMLVAGIGVVVITVIGKKKKYNR